MQPETKIELEQDIMVNQKQPYAVIEKKHQNSIESLAAHPSHKTFASGSHDKSIKVWDSSTLKETATLADHKYFSFNLDKEFGHWIIQKMANSYYRLHRINRCCCGIQINLLLVKSSLAIKTKFTVQGSTKRIN